MSRGLGLWKRHDEKLILRKFSLKHPRACLPQYGALDEKVDKAIEKIQRMRMNRLIKYKPKWERYMNMLDDYYEMIKKIAATVILLLTFGLCQAQTDSARFYMQKIKSYETAMDRELQQAVGTKGDTLKMVKMMQIQINYYHYKIFPAYRSLVKVLEKRSKK